MATTPAPFNSLPANLPVFGRVDKSLPIDAGGGDPQDQYQLVEKVDFALGANTQASVRYAYQDRKTEPGTQSNSPYSGYDTGVVDKNHNINGSLTRVWSNAFTSQSKIVWNRISNEQPINGDPGPTTRDEPERRRAPSGLPDRVPRYSRSIPATIFPPAALSSCCSSIRIRPG